MPQLDIKLCMGCMEPLEEPGTCPRCGYSPSQANEPSYLAAGTMLADRYIVGRMLRYNGEGAEYIGYDTGTAAKVTIREYMPDTLCTRKDSSMLSVRSSSVAQYKAFMSEFVELNKTLAKMRTLSHINPPIDMFGENNTGYVVFKYIEGINLGKYLRENSGELTWEEVRDSFPPIFTTLSLVHNAGLIHRGISPDNIIVGRDGNMKLIGFCIADARTADTALTSELYRGYAAPEQYSSSDWQGTWTDVYGISALLYRILTGTAPMDAKDRLANDALPEPRALNSDIPANVSKVIMDGMKLSGEDRIQTVTEFVTELFEEPEPSRKKTVTQTVSIPKQKKSESAPKRKDQRGKVFWLVLFASALGMMVLLSILIMSLDDNSANGLMGVTTPTKRLADMTSESDTELPEVSDPDVTGLPRDTSSGMSALPTLAVLETTTGSEGEESRSTSISVKNGGTVYIMNDLTGKTFDMIKNTAVNDNLNLIPDYVYTDEHERGIIFAQSLEKGSPYEKGQECVISISLGPGIAVVPEYTGLSRKDYFDLLNSRGIKYEEKSYETEDVLNGYVAWIGMEPGDEINIEEGEILEVFIAKNNRTETTTVSTTIVTIPTVPEPTAWITTEPIVFVQDTDAPEPPPPPP
ncbi:MAG: protein kinase, partial [Oscillospiraceae bacterium]|nr:protein kinase [Oscillospiraceae bacterium]